MLNFRKLFPQKCAVIGMVHVDALPGTPLFSGNLNKTVSKALKEVDAYLKNEVDAIMIENMHDIPYVQSKDFGPEVTSSMARICTEIRRIVPGKKPLGIQVLAGGNVEAVAIAKACDLNFVRAEGFVFAHIGDEGYMESDAGKLLRYRKYIEAQEVLIFTDVKKKHSSHMLTSDVSLGETAQAADFFLSDGIVLTGTSTGIPPHQRELQLVKKASNLPILIGSGVTLDNLESYITADAVIVGSYFKENGKWSNALDAVRVKEFMEKIKRLT